MPPRKKHIKAARRSARTVSRVVRNTRQTGELAVAAGRVVTKRMSLAAEAIANPLSADHVEFSRMVPEKVEAFTHAGRILAGETLRSVNHLAGFVTQEWLAAGRAAVALATARNPLALAAAQSNAVQAWWGRALTYSTRAYAAALQTQAVVTAPVHRAAVGNARRLKETG